MTTNPHGAEPADIEAKVAELMALAASSPFATAHIRRKELEAALRHILSPLACPKVGAVPRPMTGGAKPIHVEAVAEVVEREDGLELRWLIEGGVAAMADGCLLVMADAPITDEYGRGGIYTTPPDADREIASLRAEVARLREALSDAATSLETLSRLSGRRTNDDGTHTFLCAFWEVRGYAGSRAAVAREALAESATTGEERR